MPVATYNIPGLHAYTKNAVIAISLILGGRLSGHRQSSSFQWRVYDLPMIIYCLCPMATSFLNQLSFYDGLSASYYQAVMWGIPYLAGRIYFESIEKLRDLCIGIVVGGLLYIPLCLYEIRMSPQLSNMFYGFFPHSFVQHMRYGGFRPIVFMQHGLMVALWMALSSTVAFWLWRGREIERIKGFPLSMPLLVVALVITTVLCKSASGLFALVIGCCSYYIFKRFKSNLPFLLLLIAIPFYVGVRTTDCISIDEIKSVAENFVDKDRIESLGFRLMEENLFSHKTLERPYFGWGGYSRGWPVNPDTGENMIKMIDATWLITFNTYGFVGLVSLFMALLIGPWYILCFNRYPSPVASNLIPTVLSLVVILFMIDALFNGMVNPVYILVSGALMSWHLTFEPIGNRRMKEEVGGVLAWSRGTTK